MSISSSHSIVSGFRSSSFSKLATSSSRWRWYGYKTVGLYRRSVLETRDQTIVYSNNTLMVSIRLLGHRDWIAQFDQRKISHFMNRIHFGRHPEPWQLANDLPTRRSASSATVRRYSDDHRWLDPDHWPPFRSNDRAQSASSAVCMHAAVHSEIRTMLTSFVQLRPNIHKLISVAPLCPLVHTPGTSYIAGSRKLMIAERHLINNCRSVGFRGWHVAVAANRGRLAMMPSNDR